MSLELALVGIIFVLAATPLGAFIVRRPGVVLAVYSFSPMLTTLFLTTVGLSLNFILAPVVLAVTFFHINRGQHVYLPRLPLWIWYGFLVLVVIGSLYAPDSGLAAGRVAQFALLVFFPCILAIVVSADRSLTLQFVWSLVAISGLISLAGVFAMIMGPTVYRLRLFGANPVFIGTVALLLPLLAPSVVQSETRLVKNAVILMAPFGVLVAVATGSRGPIVSAILTVIVGTAFQFRSRARFIAGSLSVGVLAGFSLMIGPVRSRLPSSTLARLNEIRYLVPGQGSSPGTDVTTGRSELYGIAKQMFLDRPLWGQGTGSFAWTSRPESTVGAFDFPHNAILQFASEYGLVGVSFFILVIAAGFINGAQKSSDDSGRAAIVLGLFAFFTVQTGTDILRTVWVWVAFLILIGLRNSAFEDGRAVGSASMSRDLAVKKNRPESMEARGSASS